MKKFYASLGVAAMLLAMAPSAFAADIVQTGDRGADVRYVTRRTTVTAVSNSNSAFVMNAVGTSANSGGVMVASGIGDVTDVNVATGEATATSNVSNELNTNETDVDAPACGCETSAQTVDQFGDRGADVVRVDESEDVAAVENSNGLAAVNLVGADSTTGDVGTVSGLGDVKRIGVATGKSMGTATVVTRGNTSVTRITR